MALLTCMTGPVQWTCTLKNRNGTPTLILTMGEKNTIPEVFKEINLFDLFGDEMDHHPMDDVQVNWP